MKLIKLMGASMAENDSGVREYKARGPVWIRPEAVTVVYEHTVCTEANTIRVMQTSEEIMQRIIGIKPGEKCTAVVYADESRKPRPGYVDRAAAIEDRLAIIEKHLAALESMIGKKQEKEAGA